MHTHDISNSDDIIDIRNVIERVEQLHDELQDGANPPIGPKALALWFQAIADDDAHTLQDAARELLTLTALLDDCKGNGGDEQWQGDWYPVTLIRDSYFRDYAEELADDIGAINRDALWPCNCIDWDETADQLKQDYTTVEFDGVTYWVR